MFGLARDGKVNAKGLPDPLQLAVMAHEYGDVIRFAKPPALVQQLTIAPLTALGRRRGRKPMYPEYPDSGPRAAPDPAALAQLLPDGRLRPWKATPLKHENPLARGGFRSSGGGIRTRDLRVMSPTSYQTAPPRGVDVTA